jgi:hypothetical protein
MTPDDEIRRSYCPLPPGWRAVYYDPSGGEDELIEEPIVALTTGDTDCLHMPITCSSTEGFDERRDSNLVWFLSPDQRLDDLRDAILAHAANEQTA